VECKSKTTPEMMKIIIYFQITYLAAMAKENEHKLKEQWAKNAANRKAAGAKYGF
jgi:hypothetical protein